MKLLLKLVFVLTCFTSYAQVAEPAKYICPPCPADCHNESYDEPGTCSVCSMELLNANNINEGLNYKHIYPKDVCIIVNENPNVLLLDVRTPGEYNNQTSQLGKLKNAINIPIQELEDRIGELKDKEQEIIVYCSISMRSPRASKLLSDNGFTNIKNMLGGMTTWNSAAEDEVTCKNELLVN